MLDLDQVAAMDEMMDSEKPEVCLLTRTQLRLKPFMCKHNSQRMEEAKKPALKHGLVHYGIRELVKLTGLVADIKRNSL